jgi:hypothetical protein
VSADPLNVFVNVPFDDDFAPLFEALVFTISACGYRIRCALEEDDSGNIRLEKLSRLIKESPRSIHDLSRVELGKNLLPRFNMPFELGLALGAKQFGGTSSRSNSLKIMVAKPFLMPTYLSDLAGTDPSAHANDPSEVIRIVRNYLHAKPSGGPLPGPTKLIAAHTDFKAAIPRLANRLEFKASEIGGFKDYRTYTWCVAEYLKTA